MVALQHDVLHALHPFINKFDSKKMASSHSNPISIKSKIKKPHQPLTAMDAARPHFVLFPLMSPGHLIPMIDMAKLLAQHGVAVSIVTSPLNALRFESTVDRAAESGLCIDLLTIPFPWREAGVPEGCENIDSLPSRSLIRNFYLASTLMQWPFEKLLKVLHPPPSCIVSGKNLAWTTETARKFQIPRFFFDGMGCFASACSHRIEVSGVHKTVANSSDLFLVPGLPHKIELTKSKLPENLDCASDMKDVLNSSLVGDFGADGILVNTFEELESEYIREYKKDKGDKVWCVGPVSACNTLHADKFERGRTASINETECLRWLDPWERQSVVYACLGSICGLKSWQLIELGLGLEASNKPFIWVIGGGEKTADLRKWVDENGFTERTRERGLLVWGWAPQVSILSHPAVGAFLTHCGWNSALEGITAGVPTLTCPLFSEQFLNEQLIEQVLCIGVRLGVESCVKWGMEEKAGTIIKREKVKNAIEKILDQTDEAETRRKKAREVGEMARKAIAKGGSSYDDMDKFIAYVVKRNRRRF